MSKGVNKQSVFVSKDEAKRMIDASPSETICVTIINMETNSSSNTERMKKLDGQALIDEAKKVMYANHCMFGSMQLTDVLKEHHLLHCITFAQGSPPVSEGI